MNPGKSFTLQYTGATTVNYLPLSCNPHIQFPADKCCASCNNATSVQREEETPLTPHSSSTNSVHKRKEQWDTPVIANATDHVTKRNNREDGARERNHIEVSPPVDHIERLQQTISNILRRTRQKQNRQKATTLGDFSKERLLQCKNSRISIH
jgi:hypothetical protein